MSQTIRVAAVQTKQRTISYKVPTCRDKALEQVRDNLGELTTLAERAAEIGCNIAAFPEDTLGTLEWEAGHWDEAAELLRPAEADMLTRFGEVAAKHGMFIICCNDCVEDNRVYNPPQPPQGGVQNTAILIGQNGREIGRYHKVQLPLAEQARARGTHFPVFEASGIGTIGMSSPTTKRLMVYLLRYGVS